MTNLKRIQDRIDLIPALIRQVEELKQVTQQTSTMLNIVEPNYSLQDLATLEENVKTWYTDTNDILMRTSFLKASSLVMV